MFKLKAANFGIQLTCRFRLQGLQRRRSRSQECQVEEEACVFHETNLVLSVYSKTQTFQPFFRVGIMISCLLFTWASGVLGWVARVLRHRHRHLPVTQL